MKIRSLALLFLFTCTVSKALQAQTTNTVTVFDTVLFYDGYAQKVSHPTAPNVLRLSNASYTKQLQKAELVQLKDSLTLSITIKAACDNYDRIGSVSLWLLPKGVAPVNEETPVKKIEMARFITPFMNKNKQPDTVNYQFNVSNLSAVFQNQQLLNMYDFWVELNVFGVPYAAQKQVAGCEGRNDTFFGTLQFVSNNSTAPKTNIQSLIFVPITFKDSLNNYKATDTIGKTTRSYQFSLPKKIKKGAAYIITSNHGAGENGEEYIRRKHIVYVDGDSVYSYTPGGKSCEPFRKHNTQGNGIYTKKEMTQEEWTSWNNWCPGDKIPIRVVTLSNLKKGKHTLTLSVPDAQFAGQDGYFPVSIYLQELPK